MVTYATFATILTAGETLTTEVPSVPPPGSLWVGGATTATFTGPTTVSVTAVTDLFNIQAADPFGARPGQSGYNPIIAPPSKAITDLNPAWGGLCFIAGFQGNDPPFALTPQSNLSPSPTSVEPPVFATPASPNSAVLALPQQTGGPTTVFTPQTATHLANNLPHSSNISNDPVARPSNLPLQQGTNSALGNIQSESSTSAIRANGGSNVPATLTPALGALSSVSAYVIGSQTLVAGGSAITISNTPISLAPSASYIVIGSNTQTFTAVPASAKPKATPVQQITAFGSTYTANSASEFIIGSQTLAPGGTITVLNTPFSLGPSAGYVIISGQIQTLVAVPVFATSVSATLVEAITIFGSTFQIAASAFIISSQTLTFGSTVIVSGTRIVLPASSSASYVLENASSVPLALITPAPLASKFALNPVIFGQTLIPIGVPGTTQGLASLIMNPFGGSSTNTSAGIGNTFMGKAAGVNNARSLGMIVGGAVVALFGTWTKGVGIW
ncbi:hypothetical protein MMC13_008349 [Lambiella insularis]|nr:hypothetical protein [Lambiella insularis]